jgi:hypothetical protein
MEGWREAIRIGFEYGILRAVGVPLPLSKACKVFEGESLRLDFGFELWVEFRNCLGGLR